jgi:hypothetical protein
MCTLNIYNFYLSIISQKAYKWIETETETEVEVEKYRKKMCGGEGRRKGIQEKKQMLFEN